MKLSWYGLKMTIVGGKLSHLVQKDKIWDHGSMIEQVKIFFFKLQRTKNAGNIRDVQKFLTEEMFENLEKEMNDLVSKGKTCIIKNPVIKEVAVIEVHPAKNKKPDSFIALIRWKGIFLTIDRNTEQKMIDYAHHIHDFTEQWSFVRQGDWWILEKTKK